MKWTSFTGIVDEDNFGQELAWRAGDDRPHRSQQRRLRFVMEHDDDTRRGQKLGVILIAAPVQRNATSFTSIVPFIISYYSDLPIEPYVRKRAIHGHGIGR